MTGAVRAAYDALVAAGELRPEPAQQAAADALDSLNRKDSGLLARLTRRNEAGAQGVYLWGGVGRGKTMLMDLAFDHLAITPKRRIHFHEFILETHALLREARRSEEGDPIEPVAEAIAETARLLCFDEMQVNNPADAMILSRLFGRMLEAGVVVVTTSNRPPRDLYKDGLNR